jgi:hypothetical protein
MRRFWGFLRSLNWSKAIPGMAASLVSMLAPASSFYALRALGDDRITAAITTPVTRAVMNLYLQISTLFVALLIIVIASISYAAGSNSLLRKWGLAGLGVFLLAFVWLFAAGGITRVSLDYYVPTSEFRAGDLDWPPFRSLITWGRLLALGFSGLLTIVELRVPKNLSPSHPQPGPAASSLP